MMLCGPKPCWRTGHHARAQLVICVRPQTHVSRDSRNIDHHSLLHTAPLWNTDVLYRATLIDCVCVCVCVCVLVRRPHSEVTTWALPCTVGTRGFGCATCVQAFVGPGLLTWMAYRTQRQPRAHMWYSVCIQHVHVAWGRMIILPLLPPARVFVRDPRHQVLRAGHLQAWHVSLMTGPKPCWDTGHHAPAYVGQPVCRVSVCQSCAGMFAHGGRRLVG